MMPQQTPLRIFVAMPGTDMGAGATWNNPAEIKTHFLEPILNRLQASIRRQVELVIEKDKFLPGSIHASMFREAIDSDIYIVDLTGNNPNVYLELGVRWALRDGITIVVSQNIQDIKFNAAANRAISYGQNPRVLSDAIEAVVQAVQQASRINNYCDSPVRLNSNIMAIPKSEYDQLRLELERLQQERGEDLLRAGKLADDPEERARLFRHAVEVNPTLLEGLLLLGEELRKLGKYPESIHFLQRAVRQDPNSSQCYRELGVALSKNGDLTLAVEAFNNAVRLDPNDAESFSNLAGNLRRLATAKGSTTPDWNLLNEARDAYDKASKLNPYDTYPALNLAKLELMISKIDPSSKTRATDRLSLLRGLCDFKAKSDPTDYWRKFDLADAFLLSGDTGAGATLYHQAMASVPEHYRPSVYSSVASPLTDLLHLNILDSDVERSVNLLVAELQSLNDVIS